MQYLNQVLYLGPSLLGECDQGEKGRKEFQTGMNLVMALTSRLMTFQEIYSENKKCCS